MLFHHTARAPGGNGGAARLRIVLLGLECVGQSVPAGLGILANQLRAVPVFYRQSGNNAHTFPTHSLNRRRSVEGSDFVRREKVRAVAISSSGVVLRMA